MRKLLIVNSLVSAALGAIIGALVMVVLFTAAPATTSAQSISRLYGTHPTTGRAIPISTTAEGYINVKVIP